MSAAKKLSNATRPSTRKAGPRGRDVILERIESQMQFVIEAVTGLREELIAKLDKLDVRLSDRMAVLGEVVRPNCQEIRMLRSEIAQLRSEVAQLRHDFDYRAEIATMNALEVRVARVEEKLGIVMPQTKGA